MKYSLKDRLTSGILFLFILSLFIYYEVGQHVEIAGISKKVEVVAHRGAAGYAPENTMSAFHKALHMEADYIELDIHVSKDGHLIVMHDLTLNRTTDGYGSVSDYTLEELKELDAGSYFSEKFAGEQIPTLDEVLEEFLGEIGILIEMKSPWNYPDMEVRLSTLLTEALEKYEGDEALVIVQSFDQESLKSFKELMPEIPVAVLIYNRNQLSGPMLQEYATYADYVNPRWDLVTSAIVQQIHSYDMRVMTWTSARALNLGPYVTAGVDGIITGYPDNVPKPIIPFWLVYITLSILFTMLIMGIVKRLKGLSMYLLLRRSER